MLPQLLSEVATLLEALPPGAEGEYWRFRLNNIKAAAELALMHGSAGCVRIG